MSTQIVLLVHGMGTHPPGKITETFTRALNDRASCFELEFDLDQVNCRLEEYNYSELFDEVRQQFADNAEARQQGFSYLTGQGFAADLITELTGLEVKFGKEEFLYTHWLDVLLYGTTYYGEKVRNEFAQKYHELGMAYEHRNLHVVCHSLGTAVVHDTLAKLYRPGGHSFDNIPDYPPGNFNMKTLWTFANVSRLLNLLNGLKDPNHSTVVPGGNGCTDFFFNTRNELDPFTLFLTYRREAHNLIHMKIEDIRRFNTHDFYEYVTAPEVSRYLLAKVCEKFVDQDKYDTCMSQYRQKTISEGVDDFKNALGEVLNDPTPDNMKKAMAAYKVVIDAAKAAGEDI